MATTVAPPAPLDHPPRRRRSPSGPVPAAVSLVVAAGVLVWSRLVLLGEPFWQDEAHGIYAYVEKGPSEILFGDYGIDNHMLFELASWVTSRALGTSEVVYRLPSVVPALVSALWLAWWLWSRMGRWPAVAFTVLVAVHPLHLDLARQARGYGLTYLAMAGLIVFGDAVQRSGRRRDAALFAVSGFVGVWTFPFFAVPFAFAAAVLLLDRKHWRTVAVALALCAVALLAVLANALPQLRDTADGFQAHSRLESLTWKENLLWPHRQVGPSFAFAVEHVPELRRRLWPATDWEGVAMVVLGYPLMAWGAVAMVRQRQWRLAALLLAPPVGTYLFVTARHMALWERYASYLLYPSLVLLVFGARELLQLARRDFAARAGALAAVAFLLFPLLRSVLGPVAGGAAAAALALGAWLATTPRRTRTGAASSLGLGAVVAAGLGLALIPWARGLTDTALHLDEPPRENYRRAAALIPEGDSVTVGASRLDAGSIYYVGLPDYSLVETAGSKVERYGDRTTFVTMAALPLLLCAAPGHVVFIDNAMQELDLRCLEQRGFTRTRIPTLLYGGSIDVWVSPPP